MNRVDVCERQYKELFDALPNQGEGTNPELMQILQRFIFGEVSQIGHLDNKLREMITITILATFQCMPQLKGHLLASLRVGVSPIEIRETIYQMMPFIGCPKTLNAVQIVDEVFKEKGISLPLPEMSNVQETDRYEKGLAIQEPLYGSEIKDRYQDLPTIYAQAIPSFLTSWGFGDFYTRKGLTIQTRELLILVVLVSLGNVSALRSHVYGNFKVGNNQETILATLIQAMPYIGIPMFFNALNAIKDLLITKREGETNQ